MVMEYVSGGELFDYIVKHGKLKEEVTHLKCLNYVDLMVFSGCTQVLPADNLRGGLLPPAQCGAQVLSQLLLQFVSTSQ